jgi:hypothetical protein
VTFTTASCSVALEPFQERGPGKQFEVRLDSDDSACKVFNPRLFSAPQSSHQAYDAINAETVELE